MHDVWFGIWTNKVFCREIINAMIMYPRVPVFIEDAGGGIINTSKFNGRTSNSKSRIKRTRKRNN